MTFQMPWPNAFKACCQSYKQTACPQGQRSGQPPLTGTNQASSRVVVSAHASAILLWCFFQNAGHLDGIANYSMHWVPRCSTMMSVACRAGEVWQGQQQQPTSPARLYVQCCLCMVHKACQLATAGHGLLQVLSCISSFAMQWNSIHRLGCLYSFL